MQKLRAIGTLASELDSISVGVFKYIKIYIIGVFGRDREDEIQTTIYHHPMSIFQ